MKPPARKTSGQGIKRIGFFAPTDSEVAQRIADGIIRYQAEKGGCVLRDFRFAAEEPEDQEAWAQRPRPWESWEPDGLVVNCAADPGLNEWVAAGNVKVVNTGPVSFFPTVYASIAGIAKAAFDHFRKLGFEHFAAVTPQGVPPVRVVALQKLMAKHGIKLREVWLEESPSRWDFNTEQRVAADAALVRMLKAAPKPLAVVAANDHIGRVVCIAAEKLGLTIPTDVAVLGIANMSAARTAFPPLSSIEMPSEEIGYHATELLVRLIEGRSIPAKTELPSGPVIARKSTTLGSEVEADVVRARQIIRDRACEGVSIDEILDDLKVSRSTLMREFASVLGRTPGDEMTQARLERSKELLRTTTLPIARVSHMVGYASPSNFAIFFRRETGMTPREFRKG